MFICPYRYKVEVPARENEITGRAPNQRTVNIFPFTTAPLMVRFLPSYFTVAFWRAGKFKSGGAKVPTGISPE